MKECGGCCVLKSHKDYYVKNKKSGSLDSKCKECRREECRLYRIKNPKPPKPKTPRMDGFRLLPDGMRKCGDCKEVKEISMFYSDSTRASGTSVYCKQCATKRTDRRRSENGAEMLAVRRKWTEENRETLREKDRLYREANRDRRVVTEARRRARKRFLPDTLTLAETDEIMTYFNGKCALCDNEASTLDHFVPLKTNEVGTVKGNIIPLCGEMNASKSARNPFEWAETYLGKEERNRFEKAVEYLSEINGLTVEQYREFVFSCFKNIRIS